jgi:predicted dehydrogenase
MQIYGTKGRIELLIPFNAPVNRPCRILIDTGADVFGGGITHIDFDICNQYTIQGDRFSKAILDGEDVVSPLEDAVKNMACIDAIFKSADTGCWEALQ